MNKEIFLANTLEFIQKARVAAQVRKSHLEKNKKKCDLTEETILKVGEFEDWLNGNMEELVKNHPAYPWFSKVKGVGNLNIGKVTCLIDIEKASQISKLWRYAGFGCVNGNAERRRKGETLHFNMSLKAMCWRLGKSLIRARDSYYDYYIEQKKKLREKIESKGMKIVPAEKLPKEKGKKTETADLFSLGHLDNMAMRKMIKLFLSHLWLKWREAEGLEVTKPYAHAIQGHDNFRTPEEFIS